MRDLVPPEFTEGVQDLRNMVIFVHAVDNVYFLEFSDAFDYKVTTGGRYRKVWLQERARKLEKELMYLKLYGGDFND